MKIPVPDEVREALEDTQLQMRLMNERLAHVETLLEEIRDHLAARNV